MRPACDWVGGHVAMDTRPQQYFKSFTLIDLLTNIRTPRSPVWCLFKVGSVRRSTLNPFGIIRHWVQKHAVWDTAHVRGACDSVNNAFALHVVIWVSRHIATNPCGWWIWRRWQCIDPGFLHPGSMSISPQVFKQRRHHLPVCTLQALLHIDPGQCWKTIGDVPLCSYSDQ